MKTLGTAKKLGMAMALVGMAACAGSKGDQAAGATVSDADMGRLSQGQMGPVEDARQFLGSARDERARAQLRLQQVTHEDELAKADAQAAQTAGERAAVAAKVADSNREPQALQRAQAMKQEAAAKTAEAAAHAKYAEQVVEARKAAVAAADDQVALAEAKLEKAKLESLQQANIPAAGKYDMTKFSSRVADAQKNFDQKLQKARDLEAKASSSEQAWNDAQRTAQRHDNSATPTGTGTR